MYKIVTYNVCMHYFGFRQTWNDKKKERGEKIIEWLRNENFDTVCLQEVWYGPFVTMLESLKDVYPFHAKSEGYINSGLYTLSKFPFIKREVKFQHQGSCLQKVVPRSMMVMTFDNCVVVNSHLTSPEFYNSPKTHQDAIDAQMDEIYNTLENTLVDDEYNWYICADFNHEIGSECTINSDSFLNETCFSTCFSSVCEQNNIDTILSKYSLPTQVLQIPYSDHFPVVTQLESSINKDMVVLNF